MPPRTVALTESAGGDVITALLLAQMGWGGITAMVQRLAPMDLEVRAIVTEPPHAQTALGATEIAMGAQSALMGSEAGAKVMAHPVNLMALAGSVATEICLPLRSIGKVRL